MMENDKLDRFIRDNTEAIFEECNVASADHRNKFALKLGAASAPKRHMFRLDRVLSAAIFLIGIFLIQNSRTYQPMPAVEVENYAEVANYFIGAVNSRIDSLIKKAEVLDPDSRALIISDLRQMKEENMNVVYRNPKYNISVFEAAAMAMSQKQNEVLNRVERVIAKNNEIY